MRIEILPDDIALAARAAGVICGAGPRAHIGLPTGGTPVRAYAELARRAAAGDCDLSGVTAWAVDEFAGVPAGTRGTNAAFFARHIAFPLRALHLPDAGAADAAAEAAAFASRLRDAGGLDLCVLGIGVNGHIAFNEPGAPADAQARAVDLAPESRAAHAAAFGSLDAVPERGMTLGIADILAARAILALASGAAKAEIVRRAIEGAPSAAVPASWLQRHGNVTWLLDEAAAASLARR